MKNKSFAILIALTFYCRFGSLSVFAAASEESNDGRSWLSEFVCTPQMGTTEPFAKLLVNRDSFNETRAQFILTYGNGATVQFYAYRSIVPPGADAEIKYSQ